MTGEDPALNRTHHAGSTGGGFHTLWNLQCAGLKEESKKNTQESGDNRYVHFQRELKTTNNLEFYCGAEEQLKNLK